MRGVSPENGLVRRAGALCLVALSTLVLAPGARSQEFFTIQQAQTSPKSETIAPGGQQSPQQEQQEEQERQAGSISGRVVDQSGAEIPAATVKLIREGQPDQESKTDAYGYFAFTHVQPGPFQLSISSHDLSPHQFSDVLQPGEAFVTPLIMLTIPTQVTEIRVEPTEVIAEEQVKVEEKQRLFGVIPNFYGTYESNPVPLPAKYKFHLAWKSATDPFSIAGVAFFAGIDQASDRWGAYGQGAEGYAKRFGATYGNVFSATLIGGAVMPTLLKQDPRYFYKGSGSTRSRILRAVSSSVWCKGDNGKWEPNYSNVIGSFAGAGLEAAYVPAADRRGTSGFIVSNALVRLGETSLAGMLQEFVFPRFSHTTRSHH